MTKTKSDATLLALQKRTKPTPNHSLMIRDGFLILSFSFTLVFGVNYLFFPNIWFRNSSPAPMEVAPGEFDHGAIH